MCGGRISAAPLQSPSCRSRHGLSPPAAAALIEPATGGNEPGPTGADNAEQINRARSRLVGVADFLRISSASAQLCRCGTFAGVVERVCVHRETHGGPDAASGLRQDLHLVGCPVSRQVGVFEARRVRQAQNLETRRYDKSDPVQQAIPWPKRWHIRHLSRPLVNLETASLGLPFGGLNLN